MSELDRAWGELEQLKAALASVKTSAERAKASLSEADALIMRQAAQIEELAGIIAEQDRELAQLRARSRSVLHLDLPDFRFLRAPRH